MTHRDELAVTLFEESGDALFLFDPATESMIDANPMAERLSGFSYAELLGMRVMDLFRSCGPGGARRLRHAFRRTGQFHSQEDFLLRHQKDGVWVPVNLTVTRLRARPRTLGLITARDISERRRLEEQLRQTQKMEAIGRLAGGVAHDFNNLLTVILSCCSLMRKQAGPDNPLHESIHMIRLTAERAAALTRQLLAFSRKQVLMPVVLDLNAVIRDLEPMLHRLIGEDIRLVTDLAPGLGPVKADRHQLEQVLVNLVVNARDAMPAGGRLTIETANDDRPDPDGGQEAAGPHVALTVRDTGHGMDEHTRAHLFEPFFTTKEVGRGTGLGLATVYGIVRQSGGRITVDSAPGAGATFRIVLPRAEGAAPPCGAPTSDPDMGQGQETILLVEDEEILRDLAGMVLRRAGYTVLQARHGAEALSLCESHPGQLDLLVTDVVMPLLDGRELAERVALLRPDVKVLYISGYSEDVMRRHGMRAEAAPLLHKPFTPTALLRKVREVLGERLAAPACAATA